MFNLGDLVVVKNEHLGIPGDCWGVITPRLGNDDVSRVKFLFFPHRRIAADEIIKRSLPNPVLHKFERLSELEKYVFIRLSKAYRGSFLESRFIDKKLLRTFIRLKKKHYIRVENEKPNRVFRVNHYTVQ